jgi:hypothetical protein
MKRIRSFRFTAFGPITTLFLAAFLHAQGGGCVDVSEEPHHHLIFENKDARIFTLKLGRLESTQAHCHAHPYLYIVTGEGETSNIPDGRASVSHNWNPGEARFVYVPSKHVIQNNTSNTHQEVIVETLHPVEFNPLNGNYPTDEFSGGDLGSAKPTWTTSITRGDLTASKTQLAPNAKFNLGPHARLLIALTDLELANENDGKRSDPVKLGSGGVLVLSGATRTLTNLGRFPAKFISIEF